MRAEDLSIIDFVFIISQYYRAVGKNRSKRVFISVQYITPTIIGCGHYLFSSTLSGDALVGIIAALSIFAGFSINSLINVAIINEESDFHKLLVSTGGYSVLVGFFTILCCLVSLLFITSISIDSLIITLLAHYILVVIFLVRLTVIDSF